MIRGGSARTATIRSAPQIEGDPGHEPEEARIAGRIVMNDTAPGARRDHPDSEVLVLAGQETDSGR